MSAFVMTPQEILTHTAAARRVSALDVGQQMTLSIWRNDGRDVSYNNLLGHTFSYYIRGGHGSFRKEHPAVVGGPGKICLIPEGSCSDWGHSTELEFMHLHVPDGEIRRRYVEAFDRDARLCTIPEITFHNIPELRQSFEQLLSSSQLGDGFVVDCAVTNVLSNVLLHASKTPLRGRLIGGLSSKVARNLRSFIEQYLDTTLTLFDLSREASLSEFHLQRMFRKSFGVSPAKWVFGRRIVRAKTLLKGGLSITDISAQCGFSDQSHLTRSFRKATGVTPNAYRRAVTGARR